MKGNVGKKRIVTGLDSMLRGAREIYHKLALCMILSVTWVFNLIKDGGKGCGRAGRSGIARKE